MFERTLQVRMFKNRKKNLPPPPNSEALYADKLDYTSDTARAFMKDLVKVMIIYMALDTARKTLIILAEK